MNSIELQAQQILERYPLKRLYFDKIENIGNNEVRIPHCCYCEQKHYVICCDEEALEEPLCKTHFLLKCLSLKGINGNPETNRLALIIQELKELGLDTTFVPICRGCKVTLTDENWNPSDRTMRNYHCKKCCIEYQQKWKARRKRFR